MTEHSKLPLSHPSLATRVREGELIVERNLRKYLKQIKKNDSKLKAVITKLIKECYEENNNE